MIGSLKSVARASLRRLGLQVGRLPLDLPDPIERDGSLGLFWTALGQMWLPLDAPGDIIVRDIRAGLIFERSILELLLPHIEPGTAVIDAGANFGQMALAFADAVGPGGQVHAVEASAGLARLCRRNVEINGHANVIVHHAAVWDRSGVGLSFPEPDFTRFASHGSHPIDPAGQRGPRVDSVALDDLAVGKRVSAIKIDVQGADLHALRGARRLMTRDKPAIIFEFEQQFQADFSTNFQMYVDLVRDCEYVFDSVHLGINYLILPRRST